jgi:cation transport ATPase
MRIRERLNLLYRLAFSFIVAIPTFIIGIVYMTLVSPHNPTRMYLMTPLWAGRVPLGEWALFIMSTPVMFYSAGSFHRRSIKEIRALWRKGSKTPVWKRFVRFGSMNLLVRI